MQRILTAGVMLAITLSAPARSQNQSSNADAQPGSSWITVSGTVRDLQSDQFTLDYGKGTITVEMDSWDRYQDGLLLSQGDRVSITGKVEDRLYELASMEANSIYVEDLSTTFFAHPTTEESLNFYSTAAVVTVGSVVLNGTVTEISDREFTIDTDAQRLTVDTSRMAYDPMADDGTMHLNVNDRVSVAGHLEVDFFEGRQLEAISIVKLENADQ